MADTRLLRLGPLSRCLAFVDCPELLRHLPRLLRGWRIDPEPGLDSGVPLITLRRVEGHYRVEAPWLPEPLRRTEGADALCGFIAELLQALVMDDPESLCLHGAAVEVGGSLLVFPNRYRAGKSTLSACFAAAGHRVFADDVVPIEGDEGLAVAPGIAPRLRSPLPEDLGERTRAFLETRAALGSTRYSYLDLPADGLAPYGARARIAAFVLIERDPDGVPGLVPAESKDVLRQVIWQNFAREGDSRDTLRRLHRIVARAGCFRLRYRTAEQGVALLEAAFGQGRTLGPEPRCCSVRDREPSPAQSWKREGAVEEIVVDGESFLAEPASGAIHHLNPLASALWRLLGQGLAKDELTALVGAAYPEVPAAAIERDVAAILADFAAKGLRPEAVSTPPSPAVVPRRALG